MSDLVTRGNARASTGTTRAGPVPVSQSASMASVRTPRDIMKDRNEREARRKAEADEQARVQQDEERRRSAERRAIAAAAGVTPLTSTSLRRPVPSSAPQQTSQRPEAASVGRTPMRSGQQAYATPDPEVIPRTRASARTNDEPRPVATDQNRRSYGTSNLRQSSAPVASNTGASTAARDTQNSHASQSKGNSSSFPHAFERWEQLSSHWEGLTSYWLHKLESNQEAIARNVPSASAMSRQITDLSAAGANLFHAVVELQRLRASSERKFQRWFFETRSEQEREREMRAQLEAAVKTEREARIAAERDKESYERTSKTADSRVLEMRRELNISKEEARRAWEELGRREQEERERTVNLKEGLPTVVGGVQVVPMHASAGASRQGSQSQRPSTRGAPSAAGGGGYAPSQTQSQGYSQGEGYYDDRPGSANTDPFTEGGRSVPTQTLHHEPDMPTLGRDPQTGYQPYLGSTPATSGSVQTAIPRPSATGAAPAPASSPAQDISDTDQPERFYQQPPRQAQLYDPSSSRHPASSSTARPIAQGDQRLASPDAASRAARDLRAASSPISTVLSTEGTEYEIDSNGHLRLDSEGQPLLYRAPRPQANDTSVSAPGDAGTRSRRVGGSEASDDYDTAADVARERLYAQRYGRAPQADEGMVGYEAPSPPSALAAARPGGAASASPAPAEPASGYVYGEEGEVYETGYGEPTGLPGRLDRRTEGTEGEVAGFEGLQTRHHHPTRLSDVIEEEEGSTRGSRVG